MTSTLHEPFRAVFYTPFYLVHAPGTYAGEALDVRFGTSPGPAAAPRQLADGTAEVVWRGPLRILLQHDRELLFRHGMTQPPSSGRCLTEHTREEFVVDGVLPAPAALI